MKKKRFTKAYIEYRQKFYAEKKIGNVKNGVRVLSQYQYKTAKNYGMNNSSILKEQTILHGKTEKKRAWKEYKSIRKNFTRGESMIQDETYFGENIEDMEGLSYHYNLSGLLKDRHSLHFLISSRIASGEDREETLADYGY